MTARVNSSSNSGATTKRPTIVFHPYSPGRRVSDQIPTWEALAKLSSLTGFVVLHVPCIEVLDYADALQCVWAVGADIILHEHDIVPLPGQIAELVSCPEAFCVVDYMGAGGPWTEVSPSIPPIGLCRIRAGAQELIPQTPQVPRVPWQELNGYLGERLLDVAGWHKHQGLAEHHHDYGV